MESLSATASCSKQHSPDVVRLTITLNIRKNSASNFETLVVVGFLTKSAKLGCSLEASSTSIFCHNWKQTCCVLHNSEHKKSHFRST